MEFTALKKELMGLPNNYIVGVIFPSNDYEKHNLDLVKLMSSQKGIVGNYVSVNRPYTDLIAQFKNSNISHENIFFTDCITKELGGKPVEADNCIYIDSPKALTDISIAMHQFIDHTPNHEKFIYVDSISTLGIHNNANTMLKFVHYLTGKMRLWGIKGVMVALHEDSDRKLIGEVSQFCDKIIDMTK
jgi:hypothetical protein